MQFHSVISREGVTVSAWWKMSDLVRAAVKTESPRYKRHAQIVSERVPSPFRFLVGLSGSAAGACSPCCRQGNGIKSSANGQQWQFQARQVLRKLYYGIS